MCHVCGPTLPFWCWTLKIIWRECLPSVESLARYRLPQTDPRPTPSPCYGKGKKYVPFSCSHWVNYLRFLLLEVCLIKNSHSLLVITMCHVLPPLCHIYVEPSDSVWKERPPWVESLARYRLPQTDPWLTPFCQGCEKKYVPFGCSYG